MDGTRPSYKEEILRRVSILDVAQPHLLGELKGPDRNGRYMTLCFLPGHVRQSGSASLSLSPETNSFRCFGGCKQSGSTIDLYMLMHSMDFKEAVTELANQLGIEVEHRSDDEVKAAARRRKRQEVLTAVAHHFHDTFMNKPHGRSYLEKVRNLNVTDKIAEELLIGYAPHVPTWPKSVTRDDLVEVGLVKQSTTGNTYYSFFKDCIIFPFIKHGKCVHMTARRTVAVEGKSNHLHLPLPKGEYMEAYFNEDALKQDMTVLVESPLDALTWVCAGYNSTAILGVSNCRERHMSRFPNDKRLILGMDCDTAGYASTEYIGGMRTKYNRLMPLVVTYPGGQKDANDVVRRISECLHGGWVTGTIQKLFRAAFDKAEPYPLWLLKKHWNERFSLLQNTSAIRTAVSSLVHADPIEKSVCLQVISEQTGVPVNILEEQLADVSVQF